MDMIEYSSLVLFYFLFLFCRDIESACSQLGCDEAGIFTQDDFDLPTSGRRTVAWNSSIDSVSGMNAESMNYGCVGSSLLVVCPGQDAAGTSKHIMLNTDTGEEYDTTGYDTLDNVNMPILTKDNLVFATNSTHVSLVDPLNGRSYITKLPTDNLQGMHSTLYLPKLQFFIVFGNLSTNHSIYKITSESNGKQKSLSLVTTFSISRDNSPCPWLPMNDPSAAGNRVYFYAYHHDGSTGTVAMEFTNTEPFYKKSWELPDNAFLPSNKTESNCTHVPSIDVGPPLFPPLDLSVQVIATPQRYITITTAISLLTIKDEGDYGTRVTAAQFPTHYMSLDHTPTDSQRHPIVWLTTWPQYEKTRQFLVAFNYTNTDVNYDTIWTVQIGPQLGVDDINITSRITMFPASDKIGYKVMVLGASVSSGNSSSIFYTKYCHSCKTGTNNVLMAVRTSYNIASEPPYIYWVASLPSPHMEVRGQVIGVSDKLVMFTTDGDRANIVALK